MLIPRRAANDLTEADVTAVITNGVINFAALDGLVPQGTTNTWNANPGDRIQHGFKYIWTGTDGTSWHVHGHAPDRAAPHGGNASNGWVVRVKHGNRWLLQAPNTPPVGAPSHWTRNANNADQTHIPLNSATLTRGRSNSL
jgi:hypothetical protein